MGLHGDSEELVLCGRHGHVTGLQCLVVVVLAGQEAPVLDVLSQAAQCLLVSLCWQGGPGRLDI